MTVVVTRNVEDRFRGYLNSVMLEIAPGVYTSSRMTDAVRDRVWSTLRDWHNQLGNGAIVMTWRESEAAGGQGLRHLGEPPRELVDVEGMVLVRRSGIDVADTLEPPELPQTKRAVRRF